MIPSPIRTGGETIAKDTEQATFPQPREVEVGKTVEAVIVGGRMATGEEIFGEDARDPEQQRLVLDLSLGGGQDNVERSLPWRDPAGPKTSLGKFKAIYGDFPRKGLKVRLSMDENGWQIAGLG